MTRSDSGSTHTSSDQKNTSRLLTKRASRKLIASHPSAEDDASTGRSDLAPVARPSRRNEPLRTAAWLILPIVLVAGLESLVPRPNIPTWYASLEKPSGTPPNWVFGPVWTVLYVLMACALWRIVSRAPRILSAFVDKLAVRASILVAECDAADERPDVLIRGKVGGLI
jgi:hypothetical protein